MVRTQISLTEEQLSLLRRRAGERGTSMAALIREVIDATLVDDHEARVQRALGVVGRFSSRGAPHDASVDHDRHLTDAYLE